MDGIQDGQTPESGFDSLYRGIEVIISSYGDNAEPRIQTEIKAETKIKSGQSVMGAAMRTLDIAAARFRAAHVPLPYDREDMEALPCIVRIELRFCDVTDGEFIDHAEFEAGQTCSGDDGDFQEEFPAAIERCLGRFAALAKKMEVA